MIFLAVLLAAVAVWRLLPRGTPRGRAAGAVLGALALGLIAWSLPSVGGWLEHSTFAVLAGVTVVSATAAITLRNPVYCAIWFGLSLLGTAGLFFLQGAQFLAVATVVVYAGAILVTFLFVLMLAEPSGRAQYDRTSWEALVSAAAGALMVGLLMATVTRVLAPPGGSRLPTVATDEDRQRGVLDADRHVRQLGEALFGSRYLVAVEVAGVLLLAALVGAAVIVGQSRGPLSGPLSATGADDAAGGPPHG